MSESNPELRKMFEQMHSFYLSNNLTDAFIREQYLKMKSVYLNLFTMGDYFGIQVENNKALYKFLAIPIYVRNPENSQAWHELFDGDKTNEDVLKYFCLANDRDYESFPQVTGRNYDEVWYREWLATPIENYQSFGLSAYHAMYLRINGPGW